MNAENDNPSLARSSLSSSVKEERNERKRRGEKDEKKDPAPNSHHSSDIISSHCLFHFHVHSLLSQNNRPHKSPHPSRIRSPHTGHIRHHSCRHHSYHHSSLRPHLRSSLRRSFFHRYRPCRHVLSLCRSQPRVSWKYYPRADRTDLLQSRVLHRRGLCRSSQLGLGFRELERQILLPPLLFHLENVSFWLFWTLFGFNRVEV